MDEALDIVVVDDNPDDLKWISRLSKNLSPHCTVHPLLNSEKLEAVLLDHTPTVVFVDHLLGDDNGIELIRQFHAHFPDTTFVLISGMSNEKIMAEAIRAGASDFLHKDEIDTTVLGNLIDRITQNLFRQQYARLALTVLNQGIITADTNHRILRCNPAIEHMTGLNELELIGKTIENLFHQDDDEIIQTLFTLSDSLWDSLPELRLTGADGKDQTVTMSINSLVAAGTKIYLVTLKDLVSKKKGVDSVEKQLAIINMTSDYIGYADAEGLIQFMNPSTQQLLGVNEIDKGERKTLFDLFSPTMRKALAANIFPQLAKKGKYVGNGLISDLSGKTIPTSIVMNGFCNADDELETITFQLREIIPSDA